VNDIEDITSRHKYTNFIFRWLEEKALKPYAEVSSAAKYRRGWKWTGNSLILHQEKRTIKTMKNSILKTSKMNKRSRQTAAK